MHSVGACQAQVQNVGAFYYIVLKYDSQVEMHSAGAFQIEMHSVGAFQAKLRSVGALYEIVSKYSKQFYKSSSINLCSILLNRVSWLRRWYLIGYLTLP